MKIGIILTVDDLHRGKMGTSLNDFRIERDLIRRAYFIVFEDWNGNTITLKNREQ